MNIEQALQRLVDEAAIEKVLKLYCRAIDRLDIDLLKSLYHPDGTDDHGVFSGNAMDFADLIIPTLRDSIIDGMHTVTHCTIDVDGDFATSEAYYSAYQRCHGGLDATTAFFGESYAEACKSHGKLDDDHDYFCGGRYIDVFERRDGEWKILRRKITNEWNTVQASSRIISEGQMAHFNIPGQRDKQDYVYLTALVPG